MSPASSTPGAPPTSLPSLPGLTGRGGKDGPHRQKQDNPGAAAPRWPKFLSRKRYGLTAPDPWTSFASSQSRAAGRGGQSRKGMRPILGCRPARAGRRWFPRRWEARGLGWGGTWSMPRGRCPPGHLGTPAPRAAGCWRAAAHPARPCLTSRRAALTATPWVGSGPGRALRRVIKEPGEEAGPRRPRLVVANPEAGGRACSVYATAAGGGRGPRSGKVAGRRALRAAPRRPVVTAESRRPGLCESWRAGLCPGARARASLLSVPTSAKLGV